MPSYKLIYWDGRGRGELPRLVFAAAGEKYEDFRFQFKDWPSIKPTTPFGLAPVLEVDGKQLPETLAITKYLGNQFGLGGSGAWEQALIDAVLLATADVMKQKSGVYYAQEPLKGQLTKKLLDEVMPQYFEHMEKFIEKNGSDGFTVAKKLSVADIALFYMIDIVDYTYKAGTAEKAAKYPKVKAAYDKVANHEKVAPYVKGRPESEF